jgi:SAM-dependent methyltransferase
VTRSRKGAPRYRYLLGDARDEAARLRFQARLWDPVAHELFGRLRVRRGWRVLEVGPGQGSLHLELRKRTGRPVDAVEPSAAFRARLARLTTRDGLGTGRTWDATLGDADLPSGHYDLIFARWVFLFVPDPAARVRQLARALKPGGVLAIQDYYRDTLALVPTPPEWPAFLAADHAFFETQGGDASIASRLPPMFAAAGLEVTDLHPTIKTGHPGSPVWTWLTTYFLGVMPRLGRIRPFTPAQARRLARYWGEMSSRRSSVLISPCVVDVIGRKRK